MRIAYFTDTYEPNTDGVVTSIKLAAENLRKRGHEVYIFCPSGCRRNKYTHPIPSKKFKNYPQYKVSFPSPEILNKIRKIRPDIIHIHTPVTIGVTGLFIGKILNIPTVLTYHTFLDFYMWYVTSADRGVDFTNLYTKWFYNKSPVITPSGSIKRILKTKKVNNVKVIPNAVNLELVSKKAKRNKKPVILHVGRLCKEKRIEMILRAFRNVLKKKDARLIITSSGPYEKRLKTLAKELGITKKVNFTGYLSVKDLKKIYASSDLFVAASDTETQGLVVVEAMANGCSVIARNATGFKDVVRDGKNGLLFNTEKELEEKILILLKNKGMRNRFAKEGFKTVEEFNPDRIVERLEQYYKDNLNQEKNTTLERIIYGESLLSSFIGYWFVKKMNLPINSRMARFSLNVTKTLLIVGEILNI